MSGASEVVVRPARSLQGSVRLPGDKSISHRYAMLAAVAEGRTRLRGFSSAADCASTLACLRALGCAIERDGDEVILSGRGPRLQAPDAALDCGNSGSTMRMLAGILAGQEFGSELAGDTSLSRRPMGRVIAPLSAMGAEIRSAPGERPPLRVRGGGLRAIEYTLPVASAQVKTAVLFAALFARGTTRVEEPVRTRDHGELALRAFGAGVTRRGNVISMAGGERLRAIEATVPGDISSAAFFLCAAALLPDSDLLLEGVLLNPTRAALLDVLVALGARISIPHVEESHGELAGTVHIAYGGLRGAKIAGAQAAALIDELPVLAVLGPWCEAGLEIRDAAELRVKESDRVSALAANLRAMGGEVEEFSDGLRVGGGRGLHGARVESAHDHRIAMATAVAALRAHGETHIAGADCVAVSYPDFFQVLERLARR